MLNIKSEPVDHRTACINFTIVTKTRKDGMSRKWEIKYYKEMK